MDWYTPIARHVMIPLQARREGSCWPWYVDEIVAWEKLSAEEIRQRQWQKLEALLVHAYENVPYYRRVFERRGLRPTDIRGLDDLGQLPVLSKQAILSHGDDLVARNIAAHELVDANTGGTTGIPMRFKRDRCCRDIHYAGMAAFARWCGCNVGDRQALVWGARQDLACATDWKGSLADRLLRRPLTLNAYSLSDAAMAQFVGRLRAYRPRVLRGYPSAIEALAHFVRSSGVRLSVPATVCTAEPLTDAQRAVIGEYLQTEVFNQYAGREFGLMAMECRQHCGLHVNAFSLHLEVLIGDAPAPPGELGRLVGTDLNSYGMPLIRYELGDMGVRAEHACPCGIASECLASVEGRAVGLLVNAQGSRLSGLSLVTAMRSLSIPGQCQFVQHADLSVEVRIVPAAGFRPDHEGAVQRAVKALLGQDVPVKVHRVREIPRVTSGKYVYATSRVCPGEPARGTAGLGRDGATRLMGHRHPRPATSQRGTTRSNTSHGEPRDLLTNIPVPPNCYWGSVSDACALSERWGRRLRALERVGRLLGALLIALRMLKKRRRFTAAVVASETSGNLFALLQSVLLTRPLPTVMIDCLWYLPQGRLRRWLKALQLRVESRSVHRFVVWASHEVTDYAPRSEFQRASSRSSLST